MQMNVALKPFILDGRWVKRGEWVEANAVVMSELKANGLVGEWPNKMRQQPRNKADPQPAAGAESESSASPAAPASRQTIVKQYGRGRRPAVAG